MPVHIIGLKELRAEMRHATNAAPAEVSKALKQGSLLLLQRVDAYTPRGKTGRLAAGNRAFSNARQAGVKNAVPYATVVEFATVYWRRPRGSGAGPLSRGAKNALRHGRSVQGGAVQVTVRKGGPPPRFGYKALNELGGEDGPMVHTVDRALRQLLACHGWLD